MRRTDFAITIEEDLQLVQAGSGELVRVEPAAGEDAPTTAVAGAVERVANRRRELESAAPDGLAPVAAGLHPIGPEAAARSPRSRRSPGRVETSRQITPPLAGLRVRVSVPDVEMALRVIGGATPYIPHLLALSASSPFHLGRDTGFDSYRLVLAEAVCGTALPPLLATAAEYEELLRMLGGAASQRLRAPEWDLRPTSDGTAVEFRFLDATPSLDNVAALAACARSLTVMFADRPAPQPTATELELLRENRRRAARHGLGARFFRMDPATGEERSAPDSVQALVERLAPLAERLGDGAALAGVDRLLRAGNAATAMRRVWEQRRSHAQVVRWLIEETAGGSGRALRRPA